MSSVQVLCVSQMVKIHWMRPVCIRRVMMPQRQLLDTSRIYHGRCQKPEIWMAFLKKSPIMTKLAEELGIGAITLQDIVKELGKTGA